MLTPVDRQGNPLEQADGQIYYLDSLHGIYSMKQAAHPIHRTSQPEASLAVPGPQAMGPGPTIRPRLADAAGVAVQRAPLKMEKAEETAYIHALPTGMTRHHIVSKEALMKLYNHAATNNHLRSLDGAMKAIFNHHEANAGDWKTKQKVATDGTVSTVPDDELSMNDKSMDDVREMWRKVQAKPDEEPEDRVSFRAMQDMYQWFRGNIFEGPSGRSDDPGEGFEQKADRVVKAEHFETANTLNENIKNYLDPNHTGNKNKLIKNINTNIISLTKRPRMHPYNPDNWEIGSDGKPKIK